MLFGKSSLELKKQGDEFLKQGQWTKAKESYEKCIGKNDLHGDLLAQALICLGFSYKEMNQLQEAQKILLKALDVQKDNAEIHFILSGIYEGQNQLEMALEELKNTLAIAADFAPAYAKIFALLMSSNQISPTISTQTRVDRLQEVINWMTQGVQNLPQSGEIRFYLAEVYYQMADYGLAVENYKKTIELAPTATSAYVNMGNALEKLGKNTEATSAYNKAIALDANNYGAFFGLGCINEKTKHFDTAIIYFKKSLAINPHSAQAHVSLGSVLTLRGNVQKAIEHFKTATEIDPSFLPAHHNLGNALLNSNKPQEALQAFKKVIQLDPSHPVGHLVAALSGDTTNTANTQYIQSLFDKYAENFEQSLVQELKYDAYLVISNILKDLKKNANIDNTADSTGAAVSNNGATEKSWSILDLGCGTGLVGQELESIASQLVGVDLSQKMLDICAQRNVYTKLIKEDLLQMMSAQSPSVFDCVTCADVFVYIGRLEELTQQINKVSKTGAYFAFSVESLEQSPYNSNPQQQFHLQENGRYVHSKNYLQSLASNNGFKILECINRQIRVEKGVAVMGYIMIWQKI